LTGLTVKIVQRQPTIKPPTNKPTDHLITLLSNSTSPDGQTRMDTVIIFSRDRPLQLHCALQTLLDHGQGLEDVSIQVLFWATDDVYGRQYREVFTELSRVHQGCRLIFLEEQTFPEDLAACLLQPEVTNGFFARWHWPGSAPAQPLKRTGERFEYVLLGVDDCIFVSPFQLTAVCSLLAERPDLLGFSLRLGRNATVNYMAKTSQVVPRLTPIGDGMVSFDWTTAEGDFGYPLEVSSSVYRVADLWPVLAEGRPHNPNLLEYQLTHLRDRFANQKPLLATFETAVAFCNPINLVQTVSDNRAGVNQAYGARELSRRFAQGQRVRREQFRGFIPSGCHQEVPLEFELQPTTEKPPDNGVPGLVSVVIPTFNRRELVIEAIASVLAQTYANLEVLVIDDGSTDGTGEAIAARYPSEPRLRYTWQPNAERSAARNTGIAQARGEFVAFLDSDDHWLPDKLEKQLAVFAADPSLDLVHADFTISGNCETAPMAPARPAIADIMQGHLFPTLLQSDPIGTLTVVVRRTALWERGVFSSDRRIIPFEDWELWTRITYRSRVGYVPERLAVYRSHDGNTGVPIEPADYLVYKELIEKVLRPEDREAAVPAFVEGYWLALLHGRQTGWRLLAALPAAKQFAGWRSFARKLWKHRRRFSVQLFGS
jgi:glycosyltransferase involved in cell wall biosynthesis